MNINNARNYLRNNSKLSLFLGIVVICYLIVSVLYYKDYIQPLAAGPYAMAEGKYIDIGRSKGSTYYSTQHHIEIKHGKTLEQEFLSTEEVITGFQVQFILDSLRAKDGEILFRVEDKENGQTVTEAVFSIRELAEDSNAAINLSTHISGAMNKRYAIILTPTIEDESSVRLQRNLYDGVYGTMSYMGEEQQGDIIFAVYSGDLSEIKNVYFLFIAVFLLGLIVIISFLWINHQNTAKCVAAIVLVVGLMYSMVLPSSTLPDENRHIRWAYANSSWILGVQGISEEDTILMREGDLWLVSENRYPDVNTYVREYKGLFRTDNSKELINTGEGSRSDSIGIAYLPQALGMAAARLLNLGSVPMLIIGRVLGFLVYAGFIYWAVRLMPFGKMLIGVVSILPMTIWLGTGYSYDMLSIGSAYLFIAYVFHLAYAEGIKTGWKEWVKLSVLLAILSSIKVVYISIGFLAILIPYRRSSRNWKKYVGVLCTWLSGLMGAFLVKMYLIFRVLKVGQTSEALHEAAKYYPAYFLEHPLRLIRILVNTPIRKGDEYLEGMIGQMGWLNINIPVAALIGFGIILFLCICYYGKEIEKQINHISEKIIVAIAAFVTALLVMAAMLFAETKIGTSYIMGLQGRYFLPVIPLILILFKNRIVIKHQTMNRCIFQATIVLHMVVIMGVFAQFLQL